jgi:hypothetical protein
MSFEKLLGELEELQALQKSEAADNDLGGDEDDKKIAEAADTSNANEKEPDGDEDGEGKGDDDGDEPMGKSFAFTLDSGEVVEAIDGTELVKSLMGRIDNQEQSMQKAIGIALDLIKSQGAQITLLKSELTTLGNAGRGRKTVVSVAEKPAPEAMQKSEPSGVSGEEFMAKALTAQASGRITGLQVSIAETALQKGLAVPADIVNKVLS